MTMTRQHFTLIAEVISSSKPSEATQMAHAFADKLRETNSRFNRERFLEACGVVT